VQDTRLNLDARLTIEQLVMYFGGDVTKDAITKWVRRGLVVSPGKDEQGRTLIRLGDALAAEAKTHGQKRGRPRKNADLLSA
jgi:hypothetical protein